MAEREDLDALERRGRGRSEDRRQAPRTARDVQVAFEMAVRAHWPRVPSRARWTGADVGKAAAFVKEYGSQAAGELVRWAVEHWLMLRKEPSLARVLPPAPAWGALYTWRGHIGAVMATQGETAASVPAEAPAAAHAVDVGTFEEAASLAPAIRRALERAVAAGRGDLGARRYDDDEVQAWIRAAS